MASGFGPKVDSRRMSSPESSVESQQTKKTFGYHLVLSCSEILHFRCPARGPAQEPSQLLSAGQEKAECLQIDMDIFKTALVLQDISCLSFLLVHVWCISCCFQLACRMGT